MKTEVLTVGKEFMNMKDMCNQLGLKYKDNTNSRKAVLKEVEQYAELRKEGRKFTVQKIYNEKVEKIDGRGLSEGSRNNNSVYAPHLDKIIANLMQKGSHKQYFTLNQLAVASKIVNSHYQSIVRNKITFIDYLMQEYLITNRTAINNTFITVQDIVRHSINGSIKRLSNSGVISSISGLIVVTDYEVRMATEEESSYMNHVESLVLKELDIKDKRSLIHSLKLQQQFYGMTDSLFKEKYSYILKVFKGYELTNCNNTLTYTYEEIHKAQNELNILSTSNVLSRLQNIQEKTKVKINTEASSAIFGVPKRLDWFSENIIKEDYIESGNVVVTMIMDLTHETESVSQMKERIA